MIIMMMESVEGLASPVTTPSSSNSNNNSRRAFCGSAVATVFFAATTIPVVVAPANAQSTGLGNKDSVVQREKNTFEALIKEFKNTDKLGGLDASKLNEPSIPFIEFGEKMKKGEGT
jgi:hypothetical protein